MNAQHIRIECDTKDCPNYMVIHGDDFLIKRWTCAACLDALQHQMIEELYRRSHHEPTQPEQE